MASRTIVGRTASKSKSWMLCSTVIIVIIANFCLSVDAIRCHQCNSHIEEDCTELRLNVPRAPVDEQFLKECVSKEMDSAEAFCRKTAFKIDVSGEHRIIRDCGWKSDRRQHDTFCFDDDNEGYKQTICTCNHDGCNGAPTMSSHINGFVAIGFACLSIFVGSKFM